MCAQVSSGALHQRKSNAQDVQVAIIGLTQASASMGMALRDYSARANVPVIFTIAGYDAEGERTKQALQIGAVDRIAKNIENAVEKAAIVLVDVKPGEQDAIFETLGETLPTGAVVLDMAELKQPGVALADKYWSRDADNRPEVYLIGFTPLTRYPTMYSDANDLAGASASLFNGNDVLIVPSAKMPPEAVKVASDIADFLNMSVRFLDPGEHDGLAGLTAEMPRLLALLLFQTVQQSSGKTDLLRVANYPFANLLRNLRGVSAADVRTSWQHNRMNMLHHIEQMAVALESIREVLLDNDPAVLDAYIEHIIDGFEEWEIRRRDNRWDEDIQAAGPGATASTLGGFVSNVLNLGRKKDNN